MQFDEFTVVLLTLRDDAPELGADAAAALQDAHLAHLADLQERGKLLAVGPLTHEHYRGLCILGVGADEARALAEADPAVQGGRFATLVIPWNVPRGVIAFPGTVSLPRSAAEVVGD
jgi:uncharacterized protein YciI